MKKILPKAILGGALGTVVLSLMGKFVAPIMIGQPMDVPSLIAGSLNAPFIVGVVAHFATGAIVFPIAYLLTVYRWVPAPAPVRGILFGILAYLGAMLVMIPALGQGLFFGNAPKALVALVVHIVFGAILGVVTGSPKRD